MKKSNLSAVQSAKSIVERAVRRDFVKRTAELALRTGARSLCAPLREHAFSKEPGKKLQNATLRKYRLSVSRRMPKPGETFVSHTHFNSAELSPTDLFSAVGRFRQNRALCSVIHVMSSGRLKTEYHWELSASIRSMRDYKKKRLAVLAKQAAKKVSGEITEIGRVFFLPSKNLREMPEEKLQKLLACLKKNAMEFRKLSRELSTCSPEQRGQKTAELNCLLEATEQSVKRNYGALFRARYVPMPGFVFDAKAKAFAKPQDPKEEYYASIRRNSKNSIIRWARENKSEGQKKH